MYRLHLGVEEKRGGRRINFNPFITQVEEVEMEKSNRKKPPFLFLFLFSLVFLWEVEVEFY